MTKGFWGWWDRIEMFLWVGGGVGGPTNRKRKGKILHKTSNLEGCKSRKALHKIYRQNMEGFTLDFAHGRFSTAQDFAAIACQCIFSVQGVKVLLLDNISYTWRTAGGAQV